MVTGSGNYNLITEGFDGTWTGSPAAPAGWQVINNDADSYTWSQSNTWIPEVNGYAAHGMGSQDDWLISPTVALADNYLLKWWDVVESATYNNTYSVWVYPNGVTTAGDSLGVYDCSNIDLTQHSLNLSAYNGQNISIGFHQIYSGSTGYGFGIDDVTVELAPVVPILSLSTNGIEFIPTELDSSRKKVIGIANAGSGDLSGTITYTAGLSGPATFGNADNSIDVMMTPTAIGSFVGSIYFTSTGGNDSVMVSSMVGKSVATWDDDFDGDGESDWPLGWEVTQVADENGNFVGDGWEFYADGGHTGDGYTNASYGAFGTVNNDWLITPIYQVAAGDSFVFHGSDDGLGDIMTVHVSTTASNNPSSFTVQLDSVSDMTSTWVKYSYDLSSYVGTEVRLAIVYRGNYAWGVNIDDVVGPKVVAPTGPIIYEYPTQLDFAFAGSTTKIGSSDTLKFDYLNSGGASLEVTALTFEGPFSLSSDNTLPIVTGVGGLGGFNVVFSPLADSLYFGNMVVTHNAGDPIIVSLSGVGFDGVYRENFGSYSAEAGYTPLPGWTYNDDGVVGTEADFTNATNGLWGRASISGNGMMYHPYNIGADADTVISPAFELPALDPGYHYELDTDEYLLYGYASYNMAYCGLAISIDGGLTFIPLGQVNYSENGTHSNNYDLTGYSGTDVHLAMI